MKKQFFFLTILLCFIISELQAQQLKGDPWIFQAYKEMYGRQPNAMELNIQNYNSGSWRSYNELKGYVRDFQRSLNNAGLRVNCQDIGGAKYLVTLSDNGKPIAADLITNDGGSIAIQGGNGIVINTSSNIVTNASSNLRSLPGFSFGPANSRVGLSSSSRVVKTSGNGAIIIK